MSAARLLLLLLYSKHAHAYTHICIIKIWQKYLLLSLRRSNTLLQCAIYRHYFLLPLIIKTINLFAECVLNYNLLMPLSFLKSNLLLKCTVANIIWWQSKGISLRNSDFSSTEFVICDPTQNILPSSWVRSPICFLRNGWRLPGERCHIFILLGVRALDTFSTLFIMYSSAFEIPHHIYALICVTFAIVAKHKPPTD